MLDNLFDWEYPDDKTNNCIKEYWNTVYKKERRITLLFHFLTFLIAEYFPIMFAIIFIGMNDLNNAFWFKNLVICIISSILVIVFFIISYIITMRGKKKIMSDIANNKVKTFNTVVRDKKRKFGKHIISVQLLEDKPVDYIVNKKLFKSIDKGSAIIAIKYENKKGFYDKYDFILDPNTIAENDWTKWF